MHIIMCMIVLYLQVLTLLYYKPDNDVDIAKARISFDTKINAVSVNDQTPLDLAPHDSDLEELLALLGAMRYHELQHYSSHSEGDHCIDTFLDEGDDDFSTPPESAAELKSMQCE